MTEREINALCDRVRQTACEIHLYLGNGHLEKVYENALAHRLRKAGMSVQQQCPINVYDEDGTLLGDILRIYSWRGLWSLKQKLLTLAIEHESQILGYLKSTKVEHGLLMNFGASKFQFESSHGRELGMAERRPEATR